MAYFLDGRLSNESYFLRLLEMITYPHATRLLGALCDASNTLSDIIMQNGDAPTGKRGCLDAC